MDLFYSNKNGKTRYRAAMSPDKSGDLPEIKQNKPILPISAFDLQSPAKESFCLFLSVFFVLFFWPAHRFASYESSTVHGKCQEQPSGDYTRSILYNRTFLIGQLTGSDYIQWPMETFCYVFGRNKFSGMFQTRKVLEVQ